MPQGVEYGAPERIEFIGRKPKMDVPTESQYGPFIARVNGILAGIPSFRRAENCDFVDSGHHAVIAAYRRDMEAKTLGYLVVCNFDIYHSQAITVDLSHVLPSGAKSICRDLLSEKTHTFVGSRLDLVLEPCGALVYWLKADAP